jgi:Uma2 family endonuclease
MPSLKHQLINGGLHAQFWAFLEGKPCKVFHPPFDVRLSNDTVLQPDITIVCDKSKLDDKGCNGAPDMVVEILSPSGASRDMLFKLNEYLKAGVCEYWIIDPESETVYVNILEDNRYTPTEYQKDAKLAVHVLEGCEIDLSRVFVE